ncbi:MAG: hypothetical protein OEZ43_05690 [Gammaproteobacteria bacterium]|nr:hypothetical protein [Gammaproteobacteria bacterium]
MHEFNMLLVSVIGIAACLLIPGIYFYRKAQREKQDVMQAMQKSLIVSLILFAIFVYIYEDSREKKMPEEDDSHWCETHPEECSAPLWPSLN